MLRTAFRTGFALVVLSAALGVVVAQNQNQNPNPNPNPKADGHALRAKSILGASVHLKGNSNVGVIEDIVFDSEGVIDYFIVSDKGKLITVPWEAAKFNFEQRTAIINITPEQYKQVPTFTPQSYPQFYTPAYQTQIYKAYGLTPGQERRLERRLRRQ